jgi:hypothetical protein
MSDYADAGFVPPIEIEHRSADSVSRADALSFYGSEGFSFPK